jgi:uncharacterized membrane protein YecN with MAPEG domain
LLIHAVGAILFFGRIAHAWGLTRNEGVSIARSGGVVLTWLAFLLAGALLLFYAVP